jgi:hypothetical protein
MGWLNPQLDAINPTRHRRRVQSEFTHRNKMDNLKIVRFVNFSSEDFVGKWNGVPQVIPAGSSIPMEDWRARHYAKHLINRELQRTDAAGKEVYPGGSKLTSPRKPQDIPVWNELLSKCIVVEGAKEVPASNAAMEVMAQSQPEVSEPKTESTSEFKCDCGATAKTLAGLKAHQRSHKE